MFFEKFNNIGISNIEVVIEKAMRLVKTKIKKFQYYVFIL